MSIIGIDLTTDMDAALERMISFYEEEGIEYSIGAPGIGRLLVTDGDDVIGELLPIEEVDAFVEVVLENRIK